MYKKRFLCVTFPKLRRYLVFKRFLRCVSIGKINECWEWKGGKTSKGYGSFHWHEKGIVNAHVAAYELFIGNRHGKHVLHSCDNPPCCNPFHLWLGTQKQNVHDMIVKGRARYVPCTKESNGNSKVSISMVEKIRDLYLLKSYTQKKLAERFGISQSTIHQIVTDKTWVN